MRPGRKTARSTRKLGGIQVEKIPPSFFPSLFFQCVAAVNRSPALGLTLAGQTPEWQPQNFAPQRHHGVDPTKSSWHSLLTAQMLQTESVNKPISLIRRPTWTESRTTATNNLDIIYIYSHYQLNYGQILPRVSGFHQVLRNSEIRAVIPILLRNGLLE
jgi:hypothetical protein